jgi:hypothetical protein
MAPPLQQGAGVQAAPAKASRETDLYAWLLEQANELRSRKPDFIDWSELAEELDEIVALARKEAVSRLRTVLMHLLKLKYQITNRNEVSWKSSIDRERSDLDLLLDSKNLRNYLSGEDTIGLIVWRAERLGTRCSLNAANGSVFSHKLASGT